MNDFLAKSLNQLTTEVPDSWSEILELIEATHNRPEFIPANPALAQSSIQRLQMTTRSYLGSVVYHTGGMFFKDGLIRLYGSGSEQIPGFAEINRLTDLEHYPNALILGYDVLGGIFALDAGGLEVESGSVCYIGPDNLEWQGLGIPYSYLLEWLIDGTSIEGFYQDLFWKGWKEDLANLPEGKGFSLFPPPSTDLWRIESARSAAPVPLMELCYSLHGINAYEPE